MMGASLKRVRIGDNPEYMYIVQGNGWDLAHVLYSVMGLMIWLS